MGYTVLGFDTAVVLRPFQQLAQHLRTRFAWVAVEPFNWKGYTLGFIWAQYLFEGYLSYRQYQKYALTTPPASLRDSITDEKFTKSQAYSRAKARFGFVNGLFDQLLQTACIQYDYYPWVWEVAGKMVQWFRPGLESVMAQSILFIYTLSVISQLTSLPFSIYHTFVLEAAYGFNKTTPATFVLDIIKGWAVGAVLGTPLMAGFLWVVDWSGDAFVPALMAFMFTTQIFIVLIYPPLIQPLFNKLSPLPASPLKTRIEALASSLDYPLKKMYIIDGSKRSSHSNAYMYGLPWAKHIVLFDTLVNQMPDTYVEAVIAHELGHWYFNHPLTLLLSSQLNIFIIFASFAIFQHSPPLLRSFGFNYDVARTCPTVVTFFLFQFILTPTEALIHFTQNALSRRFEYQADHFAATLPEKFAKYTADASEPVMGYRLQKALIGLHMENLSTVWVDWLFSAYHHSHPYLTERLRALEPFYNAAEEKKKDTATLNAPISAAGNGAGTNAAPGEKSYAEVAADGAKKEL